MPAKLYVGNNQSGLDVEAFETALVNGSDADTPRPSGKQSCTGLQVTTRLGDDPEVNQWASSASKANRRSGRIEFLRNGLLIKTLHFFDAYIDGYSVTASVDLTPRQVFTIVPRQLAMDASKAEITFPWDESKES